jgi:hypothetical protein
MKRHPSKPPFFPRRRGRIHLGDLAHALDELGNDDDERAQKIAASLGFNLSKTSPADESQRSRSAHERMPRRGSAAQRPLPSRKPSVSTPPKPPVRLSLPEGPAFGNLESLDDLQPAIEELVAPDPAFELYDDKTYPALSQPSLIRDNTSRGIFTALLQTTRASRRIDIRALIRKSSKGLPPRQLPREQTGTLDHGCQLLLDYADSMTPWRDDLRILTHQLEKVVGRENVLVHEFNEFPLEAQYWTSDFERRPWQPKSGTPVLVVTDLGLPFSHSAYRLQLRWREFIQRCQQAAIPLILLIPWEYGGFVEKALGHYPYLFPWSPRTTASQIKGLIGPGHPIQS